MEIVPQRRIDVDLAELARSVNADMASDDPDIRKAAREQAIKIEAINQRDEQHADYRMDEGRDRLLTLLAEKRASGDRKRIVGRRAGIVIESDPKEPQRKHSRKGKGSKSTR